MPTTTAMRVPTIKDLRVKLCYICREEERIDDPVHDSPARAWTHPCSCTLIAHEQCLLKWIQTSQSTASRASNALKCPQCGTAYEMESENTLVLRGLALGNKVLQRVGRYMTAFGAAAAVGVVGTSIYICLTAYGAWAVKRFIGEEMYELILTDDPVNWPWSAYINLPLLPLSLILSRFKTSSSSMVIPLLLVWPPSAPVGDARRILFEYWSKPEHASLLRSASTAASHLWPPPPMFFGLVGFPIIRALYKKAFAHAYFFLLGTPLPAPRRLPRAGLRFNEGPFVIRIRAQFDEAEGQEQAERQQAEAHARLVAQEEAAAAQAELGVLGLAAGNPNAPNANANAAAGVNNNNNNAEEEAPENAAAAAVEAAEQLIEVDASSLGRRIGGALIVPAIANAAGELLFRLARHSRWVSAFLGVRPPWLYAALHRVGGNHTHSANATGAGMVIGGYMPLPPWGRRALLLGTDTTDKPWSQLGVVQQARVMLRLVTTALLGGSRTWVDSDPVWWRNAVGFGIFVALKDAVQLLHLWLAKRELESRRVKDRDFTGVDVKELDLAPGWEMRR